jgi:hypothetical protein
LPTLRGCESFDWARQEIAEAPIVVILFDH